MNIDTLNTARKLQDELKESVAALELWEKWNDEDNFISIGFYRTGGMSHEYATQAPATDGGEFHKLKVSVINRLTGDIVELKQQLEQL